MTSPSDYYQRLRATESSGPNHHPDFPCPTRRTHCVEPGAPGHSRANDRGMGVCTALSTGGRTWSDAMRHDPHGGGPLGFEVHSGQQTRTPLTTSACSSPPPLNVASAGVGSVSKNGASRPGTTQARLHGDEPLTANVNVRQQRETRKGLPNLALTVVRRPEQRRAFVERAGIRSAEVPLRRHEHASTGAISQNAASCRGTWALPSVWPGRRLGGSRSVLGGCPWRQPRSAPRWQDLIVVSASAASRRSSATNDGGGHGEDARVSRAMDDSGSDRRSCAPAPRRRLRCWRCRRCQPGRRPARRRRRSRRREVLPVGEVRLHGWRFGLKPSRRNRPRRRPAPRPN